MKPKVAVTLGDQAGVGPELVVRLLSIPENLERVQVQLLANQDELELAFERAGIELPYSFDEIEGKAHLLPHGESDLDIPVSQVSERAGAKVIEKLLQGLELAKSKQTHALLFGPLNKTSLKLAGMTHEDELRWFATELGFDGFTSELNILPHITTARVTSHIALGEVAELITVDRVLDAIHLLEHTLRVGGNQRPRLGVCGLNPHAGENGNFGREELDVIAPAIALAAAEGLEIAGPFPSDTIFATKLSQFDGIVTMYHDQGQIAMKLLGFDAGVTVQGGLPISIATPAHGTAFDLVGKSLANLGATQAAFEYSVKAAYRKQMKDS